MNEAVFYMIWFDDNTKKSPAQKIAEAREAFERRFKRVPERVLVSAEDKIEGYEALPTIGRSCFWLGPVEGVWL